MRFGWSKLDREEEILLSILKNDNDKTLSLLEKTLHLDFNYLLMLTIEHRISSLCMKRLLDQFQDFLSEEMKRAIRLLILQHRTADKLRKKELVKASTLLKNNGFDVTMMKGFSYDPEGVYLRNFRDIDVLVEEDKIREIVSILQRKNYIYRGSFVLSRKEKKDIESQFAWNNQYQFQCPKSKQVIEIHTNLFERDRIRLENLSELTCHPELYMKDRTWSNEFQCYIPCPEASLLLLCLHCSLKRSPGNNMFILRHILDIDLILKRKININRFTSLCQESKTAYHAVFSFQLYKIIMQKDDQDIAEILSQELTKMELYLIKRHLLCLNNLHRSSYINRKIFNFLAPFIIGGSKKQKLTWLRNNLISTKVQQENRYHTFGFKAESPFIYLTYLINPFQTTWRFFKRVIGIENETHWE